MNKHLNRILSGVAATLTLVVTSLDVSAQTSRAIRIEGRTHATTTKPTLQLEDIAEVTALGSGHEETVIALKKIEIGESPAPGKEQTIPALTILEKLKEAGVSISEVGYTFPRIISVKRASRELSRQEIVSAIQAYFETSGEDAKVKDARYPSDIRISPGESQISAIPMALAGGSQQEFAIRVRAKDQPDIRFEARASIERFGEVPVLRRPVSKGEVVGVDDVVMARMNLNAVPADAARDVDSVVGLETKRSFGSGEVLRREKLEVPSLIEAGERVTIRYRNGLLEASASGIAMDAGAAGAQIRVRNEISKKVVSGNVSAAGLVEVRP